MNCSLTGPCFHQILQARILEWVAIPLPRDVPDPGIEPLSLASPVLAGGFFTIWATWEGMTIVETLIRTYIYWAFSHSIMSDSLQPHELQHARPTCPSPTRGVHPNPCPLSWWCQPTISSSVVPFSYRPQSFPASGSFQMSQLFASGGQSMYQILDSAIFTLSHLIITTTFQLPIL